MIFGLILLQVQHIGTSISYCYKCVISSSYCFLDYSCCLYSSVDLSLHFSLDTHIYILFSRSSLNTHNSCLLIPLNKAHCPWSSLQKYICFSWVHEKLYTQVYKKRVKKFSQWKTSMYPQADPVMQKYYAVSGTGCSFQCDASKQSKLQTLSVSQEYQSNSRYCEHQMKNSRVGKKFLINWKW